MFSRRDRFFYLSSILLLFFIGANIFINSIQRTVLTNNEFKQLTMNLIPQGWGFFTKSPREIQVDAYQLLDGKIVKINKTNFCSSNLYGISRQGRYLNAVISGAYKEVKKKDLTIIRGEEFLKVSFYNNLKPLEFKQKNLLFSNQDVMIVAYYILPWAWAGKPSNTKLIYNVARVHFN